MILQEDVQTIVVVTKLKESGGKVGYLRPITSNTYGKIIVTCIQTKCSCYWPELNQRTSYGNVAVTFKEELVLTDCTVRIFKLTVC